MFTKRQFVCATSLVVATLAAACNGALDPAGQSPTAPSASSGLAAPSANSGLASVSGLTEAQAAELSATCSAFGSGDRVINGTPPPGGPPPDAVYGPHDGVGPDDRVTNGTPPSGPPAAGTKLALGGGLERLAGGCPVITFTIGGKTVRTNATTSFGSSCALLNNSDRVGVMGTAQADGSIVAGCVAGI